MGWSPLRQSSPCRPLLLSRKRAAGALCLTRLSAERLPSSQVRPSVLSPSRAMVADIAIVNVPTSRPTWGALPVDSRCIAG